MDKDRVLKFCEDTFEWGDYIGTVWDFWLTDTSGLLLVADNPNLRTLNYEPVAISHISVCQNDMLWIEGIRVDKHYRNKGIATCLLQYMVKYGIEKGLVESCALIAHSNMNSRKLFEKQGFSQNCIYSYYNVKIKRKLEFANSSLVLKYACLGDVRPVIDYLNNSQIYLERNNRYFNEWRFFKLENTFDCIFNLIDKKKLVLMVDENSKICGMSIINIPDGKNKCYRESLLQVCYLNCINNQILHDSVYLILGTMINYNKHKYIQFFVDVSFDLHALLENDDNKSNYDIDFFERFIVYCKNLK
ncbi:MAG TPA: GNAT family N-acetyltransferase [Phototrophicaceae bacterium]|nr:GNAT family N-acetyltransferase [Phototrophicaceae bacterium]